MAEFFLYAAVFVGTYLGEKVFVGWSRRRKLFDIPNARSSHTRPTPRGGGIIVVSVSLGFYFFYTVFVSGDFYAEYFIGAVLIAAISWLDDLYSISFVWRLSVHALGALLVIGTANQTPFIYPFGIDSELVRAAGLLAGFLWIVWLTNAYNFMDGIDGIAAIQALCAGVGWLLVGKILHLETAAVFGGVLAASSLGFLMLNWQPAKVFIGDVGSAFLGYSFAALPFLAARESSAAAGSFLINWLLIGGALVWLFFFDTIVTLFRRLLNGEHFWRAHRTHIYQQLVVNGFSHRLTAGLYGVLSGLNAALVAAALIRSELIFVLFSFVFVQSIALLIFLRRAKKANTAGGVV